jgi:hypothetical protein
MLNCLAFADCIEARLAVHPSTHTAPWRIIIYCDEASPGNLLRVDNTRKLQAFYWSFAEFGHKLLCKEHVWFLGGVLRSTLAGSISGGMSCVFRHLLKCFFGFSKTSMIALPLLGKFRFQTTQPRHVPAQRPPGAASLAAYAPPKLPPDPLAITERPSHTRRVSCFLIDSGQCGISKPLASRCPCEMGHRLLFSPSWGSYSQTKRH